MPNPGEADGGVGCITPPPPLINALLFHNDCDCAGVMVLVNWGKDDGGDDVCGAGEGEPSDIAWRGGWAVFVVAGGDDMPPKSSSSSAASDLRSRDV